MAKKGQKFTKYSPDFKLSVILDMRKNNLSYGEVVRKYWNLDSYKESDRHRSQVRLWERIFLEEGVEGFMVERRGRKSKGKPKKNRCQLNYNKILLPNYNNCESGMSILQWRTST